MDPRGNIIFMGIPVVRGELEISYEEQRTQDYIKAYQATGLPPPPVPDTPKDVNERLALGLPPLFEPYVEPVGLPFGVNGTPSISGGLVPTLTATAPSTPSKNYQKLSEIPEVQVFVPSMVEGEGAIFQNLAGQKDYYHFSFEELRLQAYRNGKKVALEAINPPPPQPGLVNGAALDGDMFQSISCNPPYSKHSFEEFRLAFIRLGREATSDEIIQQNNVLRLTV